MFRVLIYALIAIFLITLIRMFIGIIGRGVSELFRAETAARSSGQTPPAQARSGALKRDPVCGTYIPADASVRTVVNEEVVYFCSPECRDKYKS